MTEYRETGYGSDRYPPRDGGGPDSGGTVYRGSARRSDDQESPSIQDDRSYGAAGSPVDPTASIRGRVWRPTRGPRAEGASQGYGAPERGWRTSDGGYRSTEGGWQAPYRPYDTGEWRREQFPDAGPTSTGEIPPYSSGTGEIVRYRPPATGEPTPYQAGPASGANYPVRPDDSPPHTGEIVPYRGTGDVPGYPPNGAGAHTTGPRPSGGAPGYRDDVDESRRHRAGRGYSTGTGEIVPYRGGAADPQRHPGAAGGVPDSGRGQRRPGGTGEIARYPGAANPRNTGEIARHPGTANPRSTGEIARYSASPDPRGGGSAGYPAGEGAGRGRSDTDGRGRYDTNGRGRYDTDGAGRPAGAARRHPSETGETTRIPRQRPTSPASYPPAAPPSAPQRRALESGRRNDSPELYSYDPLTLGGGESPAMRYDRATESYLYDGVPGGYDDAPGGRAPQPTAPDQRRGPRPPDPRAADPRTADPRTADPRAADPRAVGPRAAGPRTAGYEARAIEARAAQARAAEARSAEAGGYDGWGFDSRGFDGRASDAAAYGGPRYQREPAPGPREGFPGRRPAERRYDQPPARPAPARPQRFEGTYPSRSARSPRNVPLASRPGLGPDEDEEDAPGFFHTALVTTAWYTIPLLLYTMYVLTLDGSAQAGDGESPRESALNGLLGGMPRVGVALVTSLAVALLIRLISRGWRAATIGFASAVVGGGVATVIFTALTG